MSSETYSYKGISAGKYVEGSIEALSQEEASFKLKEQKIIITKLIRTKKKAAEKKKKGGGISLFKKKIKPEDVVIFSKQFATMVKAGLPILNVLGMLRDQLEHPELKIIVEEAGGQCSNTRGENTIYSGNIISSNQKLHSTVLQYIKGCE